MRMSEVIEKMGLPVSSEFLGYVIHNPEADDYLLTISEASDVTGRCYHSDPGIAMRFQDYQQARDVADRIRKKTMIGLLFDIGDQYLVRFSED